VIRSGVLLSAFLLGFVSLVHLYRYFYHINVQFGSFVVPDWVSIPAFVIAGLLSICLFLAARKLR
jgi:hypothetical protein